MKTCRICNSSGDFGIITAREMMFGSRETFDYFRCDFCECLQIDLYPESIDKHYPSDYYSLANTIPSDSPLLRFLVGQRDMFAATGKGVVGRLLYWVKSKEEIRNVSSALRNKNLRILDVGSGGGGFLRQLRNAGFKNLTGIDPLLSEDQIVDDHLVIRKQSIFEHAGEYDSIFFNHSFEHMPRQSEVIKSASELLVKGGKLVIRIPLSSSFAYQKYGRDWVQLDAPRHFYLHSLKSIGILISSAGLEMETVKFDSFDFQFWGSELYQRDVALLEGQASFDSQRSNFTESELKMFSEEARRVNSEGIGDQAIFISTKQ